VDGAIPSKTSAAPGDFSLGRIKVRSVPPPHTAETVKLIIAKAENINHTNTSLFLTPYSQSPMGEADKVNLFNRTGLGSTPQKALAFVARISDSLPVESGGSGLASAAEPDRTPSEIQYRTSVQRSPTFLFITCVNLLVYYRIYAEDGAIPSNTSATPDDPSLGRIKAISVPPPHTAKTVKLCIAKAENIKHRTNASLFLTPYNQSPMGEADKVTILGFTPHKPLAFVARISDSERSALESGFRESGVASAAEPDTTPSEIQYRTSFQHSPTFRFIKCVNLVSLLPDLCCGRSYSLEDIYCSR
jgi:hypothetical protein